MIKTACAIDNRDDEGICMRHCRKCDEVHACIDRIDPLDDFQMIEAGGENAGK